MSSSGVHVRHVCYVAGKYTDERGEWYVAQNIHLATTVARELWRMGFAVICPHANTAHMGGAGVEYEDFLEGDFAIIQKVDFMVLLPNWSSSQGARREKELADDMGLPVFLWGDRKSMEALKTMEVTNELQPATI